MPHIGVAVLLTVHTHAPTHAATHTFGALRWLCEAPTLPNWSDLDMSGFLERALLHTGSSPLPVAPLLPTVRALGVVRGLGYSLQSGPCGQLNSESRDGGWLEEGVLLELIVGGQLQRCMAATDV